MTPRRAQAERAARTARRFLAGARAPGRAIPAAGGRTSGRLLPQMAGGRTSGRLLRVAGVLTALLLVPSGVAVAADDPDPVQWPTIELPTTTGGAADPAPISWPPVDPPEANSGTGADPQPQSWPAPEPE
ncbi:hypothetical protein E1218_15845 [Kribbella turkmenica]|uniref:Uncharacterized protein n=1 Tax=Kribbella turkmenica TaxID=2530375 RepID=A0A4R4X3N4_9ACTN|nr:hypothetical protein [Kribbella turkmenica]TDD24815.1 hypothetical protein E1218_15845 [Kribbella turkmenica]